MKFLVGTALSAAAIALAFQPAQAQKSKSTFRVATDSPIVGVTYYLDPKPDSVFLSRAVYDTLIYYDEITKKFEPLLAKSWKRIDSKTLELQLRDDVKWQDGEGFNADDVVYTIGWLTNPKTKIRFKGNWAHMKSAEKIGPYTVRVHMKRPTPYDTMRFSYLTPMMPRHLHGKVKNKRDFARRPVGTSMYRAVKIDKNKGVFLQRHAGYKHGGVKRASNIDKFQLLFIPDKSAQVAQYTIGNLEAVRAVDIDQGKELAKQFKDTQFIVEQGISWRYMAIDAKGRSGNKALTDLRVRKALMMAVNTQDILYVNTGGQKVSRYPQQMCWRLQIGCDFSKQAPGYNLTEAKRLMKEAGYARGFNLDITTFTNPAIKAGAEIVAAQLKELGVDATVNSMVIGAYRKKQRQGKIQMMVGGYPAGAMPDISGTIKFIYAPPKSRDYHGDEEMKKLARATNGMMDPQKRMAAARKVFDMAAERAYFKVLAPGPTNWVLRDYVSIKADAISAFSVHPRGLRFK